MLFKKPILSGKLGSLFAKDKGAIAIITALLMTTFVGFAALSIDVGVWHSQKRNLQIAADAGAVGGGFALSNSTTKSTYRTYVNNDLALNGCSGATSCTAVINNPPTSGAKAGNTSSVEVILTKPAQLYLSGLFLGTRPTLYARAVAGQKLGLSCVVLLGTSGADLSPGGNSTIRATGCGIQINSSTSDAVSYNGTPLITASPVNVVGNISGTGQNAFANGTVVNNGAASLADPQAGLASLSLNPGSCVPGSVSVNNGVTQSISAGTYCGPITVKAGGTLNMGSGIYYIVNQGNTAGDVNIAGTLNGSGVTIIMTNTAVGKPYGTVNVSAQGALNLSAITTGPTAGILFYGKDLPTSNLTQTFGGGSGQNLNGILYFPNDNLVYGGNATSTGSSCNQIIAKTLSMQGTVDISTGNGCQTPGFGGYGLFE